MKTKGHNLHEVYSSVSENLKPCIFFASAFDADIGDVEEIDEDDSHPSFKLLFDEGYEIITF